MNIESMGPETLRGLLDRGLIENSSDLYNLTFDQLNGLEFPVTDNDGLQKVRSLREKSAQNIIAAIEKSKETPFDRVLFGMGIRFVGTTVAEKLAFHFRNIQRIMTASYDELINAEDIGEKIAQSVLTYFEDDRNLLYIQGLKDAGLHLELSDEEGAIQSDELGGLTFVVSGVFENFGRDEIKNEIKLHGGKVVSSVSKKLDYLLAGDKAGASKLTKAEELGVSIIDEENFIQMITE